MTKDPFRIGVVAPASPIKETLANKVKALACDEYGPDKVEIVFHPQCFSSAGHFAGDDAARAAAFLEMAHNTDTDAVWFARGGYGSARILPLVMDKLEDAARAKAYLGYSDMGMLIGAMMRAGFANLAHGPMPQDLAHENGEAAVRRALRWLVERDASSLEPSVADWPNSKNPAAAFNIKILSKLIGTPWQPDLAGRVLMLEEVSEHLYAIDRSLFHLTSNPEIRKVAGLMLGRCSAIPENDRPFGEGLEAIAKRWCETSGIAYLGRADIGHDADNKIVPMGALPSSV